MLLPTRRLEPPTHATANSGGVFTQYNTHIRRPAEREVSRYTAAIAHCAASMSASASALESRPDARIALTSLINA